MTFSSHARPTHPVWVSETFGKERQLLRKQKALNPSPSQAQQYGSGGLERRKSSLFLRPGLQTPGLLGSPNPGRVCLLSVEESCHRWFWARRCPARAPGLLHFPRDGGLAAGAGQPLIPEEAPEVSLAGAPPSWVGRLSPWRLSPLPSEQGPQSEAGASTRARAEKGWSLPLL